MKSILRRVLISLVLLLLAGGTLYHWMDPHSSAKGLRVHFLYTKEAAYAVDYDGLAQALNDQGISATVRQTPGWESEAKRAIRDGIPVLVLGITDTPWDSQLLAYAQRNGTTLLFVGQYPGDDYLGQYDKAYYIGSHLEYAGELAGQQLAQGFQDGTIPDRNGNQILEYLVASQSPKHQLFRHTLAECEHHGVYTQDSLTQIPANAALPLDENGKSILPAHWSECITAPEAILCGSFAELQEVTDWCAEKGWTDVALTTFMSTAQQAEQAHALGSDWVVLYDAQTIGDTVLAMIHNMVQSQSMTHGLNIAPDEMGAVWQPYLLDSTTEPNGSDPAADGTEPDA